jgi:hypothetical protein
VTALPQTAQFYEAVRQELDGTPYILTPTPQGFDLALDLENAQWFGVFNKAGLRSSYVHHVTVAPDGTYRILDDKITFQWRAGVPTGFRYERAQGRLTEVSFKKSWGITERGEFGQITDYRFNSAEGHRLIRTAANSLGLKEKMPAAMVIGLIFGIIGGLGAVLVLVVLGIGLLAS